MIFQKNESFALKNFEGPLDFLMYLIQKEEINIYDVSIKELTHQFLFRLKEWQEQHFDTGAEFIGTASYLLWLKSKTLLPKYEETILEEISEEDPHFEIIHHLIDYCRFKQAAKDLVQRQEQQSACFFRGVAEHPEWKKPMGIDHISLDELSLLFKEMMERASIEKPKIHEEHWRVSDKIRSIRKILEDYPEFPLATLFSARSSRLELIVIFLAILELMKIGELIVCREKDSPTIMVCAKPKEA